MAYLTQTEKDALWSEAQRLLAEIFHQRHYRSLIPLFGNRDVDKLISFVRSVAKDDYTPGVTGGVITVIRLVVAVAPDREESVSKEAWLGELYLRAKQYCAGTEQYMKAQLKRINATCPIWL